VWRYNLPRLPNLDALHVYNGPTGVGLVPMSEQLMYVYVTTPEPGNPWYSRQGLAAKMREKVSNCAPAIRWPKASPMTTAWFTVRLGA
jgi:hypothetical protein